MSLSAAAVRRPIATTMLLLATILLGVVSLPRLEVTLLPEVRADRLVVWVPWSDAGVEEIEEGVVRPVEEALISVRGVRELRSRIVPGGATVTARLHPGANPDLVTLGFRERLDTIRWTFPKGVERPVILGSGHDDAPAMVLAIAATDLPAAADWAEAVLRPRLEQIDGVARAAVVGVPEREIRIVPDLALLEATGISVRDMADALRAANVDAPGGYLKRREIRFALEVDSELTPEAVEEVVIARRGGRLIRVADVARVVDGYEDPRGWSRLDGRPAVGVLLTREAGANLTRMADRVHTRLGEIRSDFPGIDVAVVADPSPFVRESIRGVWQAMLVGGVFAYGVLLVFLRDRRSPLFLMAALPMSVIPTFALLDLFGVSLNLMSLGGVALGIGMLVDNSIICLENIHRLRAAGVPAPRAAARGAQEVALPILASTLTTCAVFAPLAFVPGAIGELFRDQAIAVSVSLGVSLVVALTLLPMLAGRFAPETPRTPALPLYDRYHRLLRFTLRRPGLALGITALVIATSVIVLSRLPRELFPEVATGHLEVALRLPPGTAVVTTDAAMDEMEAWLANRPEVESVFATVGAAATLDPTARERVANQGRVRVHLREDQARRHRTVVDGLWREFAHRPGWELELTTARPELRALNPFDAATLTCEISGPDPRRAEALATELRDAAADRLPADEYPLRLSAAETEPRFRLRIREDALHRYDLTEDEIFDAVEALTSGLEATRIRRFDEENPVVIRASGLTDPATARLVVNGRAFTLREIFDVTTEITPAEILRENQSRLAAIVWEGPLRRVDGVRDAISDALVTTPLPPGYTVRFGGAWQEMRQTLRAVVRAFLLSGGLVLLILAAQFESIRLPLVIFTAVPLAAVGVMLALLLSGGSINVISAIGAVVLIGVVVNDAILKVDLLRRLVASGASVRDAIFTASKRRYRPILMTTATTSLALMPLFFGAGAELRAPLAATVIGGLVSATVLTLLVIPVLFQVIMGRGSRRVVPADAVAPTEVGVTT